MNARPSLQSCAILMLLCVVLAICCAQPSTGQAPALPMGRYQMEVGPNDTDDAIYVLDVHSGECWFRQHSVNTEWTSLGSPVIKRDK